MNQDNYASLEASKRLVEAGIVLETEAAWSFSNTGWELIQRNPRHIVDKHYLPAPSMAEVWRELPGELWWENRWLLKHLYQDQVFTYAEYCGYEDHALAKQCQNTNPTDALIDLLIFIKGLDVPK